MIRGPPHMYFNPFKKRMVDHPNYRCKPNEISPQKKKKKKKKNNNNNKQTENKILPKLRTKT